MTKKGYMDTSLTARKRAALLLRERSHLGTGFSGLKKSQKTPSLNGLYV